jgi:hypothetical protein
MRISDCAYLPFTMLGSGPAVGRAGNELLHDQVIVPNWIFQ